MMGWATGGVGRGRRIGLIGWLLVGLLLVPVDCGRLPRIHSLFEPLPVAASPAEASGHDHARHHPADDDPLEPADPASIDPGSPLPTPDLFDHPLAAGFVAGFERPLLPTTAGLPVPGPAADLDGLVHALDPPPPRVAADRER